MPNGSRRPCRTISPRTRHGWVHPTCGASPRIAVATSWKSIFDPGRRAPVAGPWAALVPPGQRPVVRGVARVRGDAGCPAPGVRPGPLRHPGVEVPAGAVAGCHGAPATRVGRPAPRVRPTPPKALAPLTEPL